MVSETTRYVHGGDLKDQYGSIVAPIYTSTVYEYIDDESSVKDERGITIKYGREENPTVRSLERLIAALEEAPDALAFNSGMSAISTLLLSTLRRGARILILKEMYSTTIQIVDELSSIVGAQVTTVYPSTSSIIDELSRSRYDMALIEVMTNPTLKVIDIVEVSKAARDLGVKLMVDNTFTTPYLVKPVKLGATASIHSTTKYISGHNDTVGGAIAAGPELARDLWEWRRKLGTIQQPFEAYLTIRGAKTMPMRFEHQSKAALQLAEFLKDSSKVIEVHYPGLRDDPYHDVARKVFEKDLYGGVLSFRVKGGVESAKRLLRSLSIARPSPSLGGSETVVTLPALTAAAHIPPQDRAALGIDESLIRVSVGLEDPQDLVEDFGKALESI